ncbi:hypothetical protein FIE12Z_4377 [Fusarium flagelliforme]|uniref:Uncharacterized protein n=1 Tax=Fusarium flagelliforme TaxID=2675880 RepID=A0A395MV50_9HYPO|nr:hypothetical protein FIE12Z_4377 [Fusarium flagelliforme]
MLAVSAILIFLSSVQAGVAPVLRRDDFHGFPVGDTCLFTGGGPVGVANAVCAVSDGNAHTDKITSPTDEYEYYNRCYCVNGNFCCDQNAEVLGGENPVDYFKGAGCNCGDPM